MGNDGDADTLFAIHFASVRTIANPNGADDESRVNDNGCSCYVLFQLYANYR